MVRVVMVVMIVMVMMIMMIMRSRGYIVAAFLSYVEDV